MKLLIGGSPCTHWSIAQKNNRETTAGGVGWELFKNYLIAKEKFKPDFFLYENNKSAAQPIKDQIAHELGVGIDPQARFTYINSTLVSAQNRQRFYVTNFGDIEQPADRGILLKDILETGMDLTQNEKSYCLTASYDGAVAWNTLERSQRTMVAEPVCMCYKRSDEAKKLRKQYEAGEVEHGFNEHRELHPRTDGKTNTLDGKTPALQAHARGGNSDLSAPATGLYAVPNAEGAIKPIYEVRDGQITIKGKQYPIKLADGYYIIRKLTVTECCRLQTLPDDYCRAVSATRGYRGLGEGWTAEVIIHILSHALKDIPRNEPITVLSMYDGIGTGRYCLDKMGFTNVEYHAYEIDKYPMAIANDNYPDIIQHGDAFQVREKNWSML